MNVPKYLIPHLRTDHAGETGAVYIYKGILFASKNYDIIKFAKKHLKTEQSHLDKINNVLPDSQKSSLLIIWKIFGFLTGFVPALFGTNFIYATIYYVESFVEIHYKNQIFLLSNNKSNREIKKLLCSLNHDEVNHKNEALSKFDQSNPLIRLWGKIVMFGSKVAVYISYKI
tara:strand:- start:2842 stop:3357 length:516 start_codon:yes stop_codon:yes gene_type:complete